MPARLPPGIITNSDSVPGEIERVDTVGADDIARLWRVFAANKNPRLENLFWRIWGNDAIRRALAGPTIARLFMQIASDREAIRTTPVQSPRSEHRKPSSVRPDEGHSQVTFHAGAPVDAQPVGSSSPERSRPALVPPSILKKPRDRRGAETNPSVDPSALTASEGDNDPEEEAGLASQHLRPPTPPRGHGEGKKKKATFVAGPASSKRRPGMGRKRSSQSSPSHISSAPPTHTSTSHGLSIPPTHPSEEVDTALETFPDPSSAQGGEQPEAVEAPPAEVPRTRAREEGGQERGRGTTDVTARSRATRSDPTWVVDVDFRTRFAARSQGEGVKPVAGKSMAPLTATSAVAVGTIELGDRSPSARRAKGKGKAKAVVDDVEPLKPEGPSTSPADEPDDALTPLARTKSQLTLLLERDRQHKGGSMKKGKGR
ncbi:MAG: hypothetical protein M1838_005899 [Thelocarpon superellum]|nr:MAG: hypothetical protein M1838_005899 [Thelocarpon superellum]